MQIGVMEPGCVNPRNPCGQAFAKAAPLSRADLRVGEKVSQGNCIRNLLADVVGMAPPRCFIPCSETPPSFRATRFSGKGSKAVFVPSIFSTSPGEGRSLSHPPKSRLGSRFIAKGTGLVTNHFDGLRSIWSRAMGASSLRLKSLAGWIAAYPLTGLSAASATRDSPVSEAARL